MNFIQYYIDLQEALMEMYINHPVIYVAGWIFCYLAIMSIILCIMNSDMVIDIIKAYIIKILRD